MTEVRGRRTEDRGQGTEDRGQKTEDRGQRTEGRGFRWQNFLDLKNTNNDICNIVEGQILSIYRYLSDIWFSGLKKEILAH